MTMAQILSVLLAYAKGLGRNDDVHVIHTPPTSTIGGFSCTLVSLTQTSATVRRANGDFVIVPIAEISVRGCDYLLAY